MSKEEFNKLWKDSTKEQILNQYYYDYEEMVKSHNIIKEVREKIKEDNLYLEEAKKMYIEDTDDEMLKIHALQLIINDLSHIDSYLKILDKENQDDEN